MSLGILRLFRLFIFILSINLSFASTKSFDFDLIKKGVEDNNTLLIVGGIQGDEPGGFMAASLITTHYTIKKGSVWVVPNLNFYSIIKRNRGPFGDMNRKFASLSKSDPDYYAIQRIKKYIASDNVKLILNLHDGSGFYRKKHIDNAHSPYRWGQSSIIDQSNLDIHAYGNLSEISEEVCNYVNSKLLNDEHRYRVRNTQTRLGDKEMEKTLTYYAINQGKAAFGNEASKSLTVSQRVYYHLLALEKYMNIMGIEFERRFTLEEKSVKNVLDNDIYITFYDQKIKLPLSRIRSFLRYFPVRKDGTLEFTPSNPLMTVIKSGDTYTIHYGNRRLAYLKPDYLDLHNDNSKVDIKLDGEKKKISFGDIVSANNEFYIYPKKGYRVNVIGFKNPKFRNEAGIIIKKNQISKRFSVDTKGKVFRVEFYNKEKFAGMVLVNFDNEKINKDNFSIVSSEKKKKSISL